MKIYLVSLDQNWRASFNREFTPVALFSTELKANEYITKSIRTYGRSIEDFCMETFTLDSEGTEDGN